MKTFLYVIGAESGPIKIGISSNPNGRFTQIRTGCPFPIKILHTREIPVRKRAFRHERSLHAILDKYRAQGEWFQIDSKLAIDLIESSFDTFDKVYRDQERSEAEALLA